MPVATHAHARNHESSEVAGSGASICLANTYHLMLRPGIEVVERFGGLHRFMGWEGGILTDSGGFQIFSLPGEREIREEGASFRSPYDNERHLLTPERALAVQRALDTDIMMPLDVCAPSTAPENVIREAMERTHAWARRSIADHARVPGPQALFAIVQGGLSETLRQESIDVLSREPFDGYAVGGLAVGEPREELYRVASYTGGRLPKERPRYLMGVGTPSDLLACVDAGFDIFDCILPGKMAQQKYAYTFEGQLRLTRTEYRLSDEPLDASCGCPVCRKYSRGYLRHLAQGNHHLSDRLLGVHNLWHYQALMARMRAAIVAGTWEATRRELWERISPRTKVPRSTGDSSGDFEVVALANGARAVRQRSSGEVMHPTGPWEESRALYVTQLGLAERLSTFQPEPLRILDVGLGAGTNAIAALTCARELGQAAKRPLEVVSLERTLDPLRLALTHREHFPWFSPWATAAEAIVDTGHYAAPGLDWRLLLGDAREQVAELGGVVDLFFFDPFSSSVNPELWTVDFFRALRAVARYDGALLATYSSATPTRVALLAAGFYVGRGSAIGTRTETTVAATRPGLVAEPLGERWLARFRRSSSRAPHGQALTEDLLRSIEEHPQFQL